MANFMECLGLGFLTESEETAMGVMKHIAQNGKCVFGYSGLPYINQHYGDAQFVLRTARSAEGDRLEITGLDTHASGQSVWTVRLSAMEINRKDADALERRCVVSTPEADGMAVVNIVNADILPSFREDTLVKLQMIAFPSDIQYFKDEDEYAEAQPDGANGRKWLLAEGTLMPAGLMSNRNPRSETFEQDEYKDDLALIRGTVKAFKVGKFRLEEEEHDSYIRCLIDTQFGELEIVHTIDQVAEAQRKNLRAGAVVSGIFFLSGDAAIYEYENGIVLDEEHDLAILRSTLLGDGAERMRTVFAENATYRSDASGKTCSGRDEIIGRLDYVREHKKETSFAHMATITSVDEGEESLPYGAGKRCIVLAEGEETAYRSIAFVDLDMEGRILRLYICQEPRYHFRLDTLPRRKTVLDDVELPDSVLQPMILRARLHGIVDEAVTDDMVLNGENDKIHENNARRMLDALPEEVSLTILENLFGYLFAKGVEAEYCDKGGDIKEKDLFVEYLPSDAWVDEIHVHPDNDHGQEIRKAMKLGKQFCSDFTFYYPDTMENMAERQEELVKALMAVQQMGRLYMPQCLHL